MMALAILGSNWRRGQHSVDAYLREALGSVYFQADAKPARFELIDQPLTATATLWGLDE
jgi:hypothetical protein